jgi:hypothetical protein
MNKNKNKNKILDNYNEIFSFNKKDNCNIILRNPKTLIYEHFDNHGKLTYKLIFIKKNKPYYYFKLKDEYTIIKYDEINNILYKMTLHDFYIGNDKKEFFDHKNIIINE